MTEPNVSDSPTPTARQRLAEARNQEGKVAARHQLTHRRLARVAAFLTPAAVLCLAVQLLVFSEPGRVSILLISVELLLLSVAVAIGLLQGGEAHERWLRSRVRSELLRREEFLYLARVGPYLTAHQPEMEVDARIAEIRGVADPVELIPLEHRGLSWRDELEDAPRAGNAPENGCREIYLQERLRDQKEWYSAKARRHAHLDGVCETGARVTLVLAMAAAALHLGWLVTGSHAPELLAKGVEVTALALPAFGGAFLALRAMFAHQLLRLSYRDQAHLLSSLEAECVRLADEEVRRPGTYPLKLRRLVLRSEEVFASELRRWALILAPAVPSAA
jgi:uncharacterized protein DUF4231/conflict system pore-forming effector with SLATT domain